MNFNQFSGNIKFRYKFEFPELDNKKGKFMIKFSANEIFSQAIIQKGFLSLVYEHQNTGQLAYILDEKNKIWCGKNTGLYFQDQFFKADSEKGGKILLPYGSSVIKDKAILYHEGYSQKWDFTRYSEEYSLTVNYIISPESLLLSNQATVILNPYLSLNGRRFKVENLSNSKAIITAYSFLDNEQTTTTYDNLKLSSETDLELKFSVPANLK